MSSKIAATDRIKQADAARILGCTRQRVSERIERGSLVTEAVRDGLGKVTVYCSLKQVKALKAELDNAKSAPTESAKART